MNPASAPLKITLDSHLRLDNLPAQLKKALMQRLAFPNPKWVENRRMQRWNRGVPRMLRFYEHRRNGGLQIPRGYMRQLIKLCRRQGTGFALVDKRRSLPEVAFSFNGNLKHFQQRAVDAMCAKDFGTLCAPTGSGKTVMALQAVARRRQPALVIVHTRDLARQWVDRIGTFLGIASREVGFFGGGRRRLGDKISVALVQTLYKCAREVSPHIGFLVVDECHRCPSRLFTEAVTAFDARYMLGLTATPWRRDNLDDLIFWHLGHMHHRIHKNRLLESGDVLEAEVVYRETCFEPFHDPVTEYSKMLAELTCDDARNQLIAADVAATAHTGSGVCLVLSDRKRHCETLQSLLRFKFKLKSDLLTGDLVESERRQVLERVRNGRVKVLVATGQLIGEGIDCENLTTLFLTTPIRFSGRLVQYLGRVLRPAPGKRRAVVYDYVDVRVETLKAAARSRQSVYRR